MSQAILADIGGTNIRFATLSPDGTIAARESWLTSLYNGFKDALDAMRQWQMRLKQLPPVQQDR